MSFRSGLRCALVAAGCCFVLGVPHAVYAADEKQADKLPLATGAKFEQDGIRIVLTVTQPQAAADKSPTFEIALENTSKSDRTFLESGVDVMNWEITLTDANGRMWHVVAPPRAAAPARGPAVIKAGEKQTARFVLGPYYRYHLAAPRAAVQLVERLPAGKYVLNVKRTFHGATKNVELANLPPLWVAEVKLAGPQVEAL